MSAAARVLIVDDEPDVRLSLRLALELAGYAVRIAANGREALEQQREEPADILITDIFMPEADGIETIAAFRKEFPAARIVVVSGAGRRANADYLHAARVLGAEYEELRKVHAIGGDSFLDTYGAQNPAEFFAVVTEMFFERPHDLRAKHPELYAELGRFYRQDPASFSNE